MNNEEKKEVRSKLSLLFAEVTFAFVDLRSYYRRALQGIGAVSETIFKENIHFTQMELPIILGEAGEQVELKARNTEWHLTAAKQAVEESSHRNRAIIDASTLVFAHSLFDGFVEDLLWISNTMYPDYWRGVVEKKKVELKEIQEKGFEEVRLAIISSVIEEKQRQSVINRCQILISLLQPKEWEKFNPDFNLELETLKEIDDKRHQIIHKARSHQKIETVVEYMTYLQEFHSYLILGFSHRHGLDFDMERIAEFVKSKWVK